MDKITILTCLGDHKATKKFIQTEHAIEKVQFDAGWKFKHEEKEVSCLQTLAKILDELLDKPECFVIRGNAKPDADKITRRKKDFFDSVSRSYVMVDIDKLLCPAYFDANKKPQEAVAWALEHLPSPFKETSCYYKFSSSQGVHATSTLSLHLWFWLDTPLSDQELKRYFKINSVPADTALFSTVQIHYTARPIFVGMDDPVPARSGILNRKYPSVPSLMIPPVQEVSFQPRTEIEPNVSEENKEKAIQLILPYYKEGQRDRICGAISGTLYRGGWNPNMIADFIYDLAECSYDEELDARYKNVFHICASIDSSSPVQGIPTLKLEIGISETDQILSLLGVGLTNIEEIINMLSKKSLPDDLREVFRLLADVPESDQKLCIDRIKLLTGLSKTVLSSFLKEAQQKRKTNHATDWSDITMELLLGAEFEGGRTLIYAEDGRYWHYNTRYWAPVNESFIKEAILPYARESVASSEGAITVSAITNSILNILPGRVRKENNPLHTKEVPSVINCLNGELWIANDAVITFKPHSSESYLKYCLDVEYNPYAQAPIFDQAVLEILSGDTDMVRHFLELAGYICQPWRKLAVIVLLYGQGSNGKSSLMSIVQKVLGTKMIMSDRIGNIEEKDFKIGALDGKLLLLDDDVDEGVCLPDGFLKKISEEKLMTGQHKHKPLFEFVCLAVPVMLANNYPAVKDLSYGVQRRMHIIPFKRQFKKDEIKVGLFDQIWEQEASGILNRFIEGFQRLRKRNGFLEPEECIVAKNEWLRRANILPTFIEEFCIVDDKASQALGEFYHYFKEYCIENGIKHLPSQPKVGERLEKLGYAVTNLNGKKHVRGIKASPYNLFETNP